MEKEGTQRELKASRGQKSANAPNAAESPQGNLNDKLDFAPNQTLEELLEPGNARNAAESWKDSFDTWSSCSSLDRAMLDLDRRMSESRQIHRRMAEKRGDEYIDAGEYASILNQGPSVVNA